MEREHYRRIWVCGGSGSGKTTLARQLGEALGLPVYHRDAITWDENDNMRGEEEQVAMLRDITRQERWIFEGARFTSAGADGRLARCGLIVCLNLNRFLCLYRVIRRARQAKGQPFGRELLHYCLIGYPKKRPQREAILEQARSRGIRVVTLRRKKDVKRFRESIAKE
ncbi:MAG: hypothetical protein FWF60_02945 [Oscillospiraceae bacterium]|nr:hypothetical protein [Oscillospiraceae bacterium]